MASDTITVLAFFKAKNGKEDLLCEQLGSLAARARKDPGCIRFELKKNPDEKGRFLFVEQWESRSLLDSHLQMPYLAEHRAQRAPNLEGTPKVEVWLD